MCAIRRMWPARGLLFACALLVVLCGIAGAQEDALSLTFAVFGDSQPGDAPFSPVLQRLAADMAGQKPAFVLGTGDYIDGARDEQTVRRQWLGFFEGIAPLQTFGRVPVALAPGNHDILGSRTYESIFVGYFGGPYYSFNRGAYHIILLDSEVPGESGRIAGRQLQWLKADLASHRQALLTFVAVHEPLFPVDGHRGESLDQHPKERDALHQLFMEEGVDCVFSGHEHLFHRQQIGGIDYVINGGAGGSLYVKPDQGGFHHYVLVKVTEAQYKLQVRKL